MTLRSLPVLICALALVLAGCSSGGTNGADGGPTGSGAGTTASGEAGGAGGDGQETSTQTGGTDGGDGSAGEGQPATLTLTVAETSLGAVLANGEGRTVYLFTPDKVGKKSVCTGPCTEVWIPVRSAGEPAAGDGVDASLISTIERPDGSRQITYNGHPLYTLVDDAAPGDVKGQSVGGVWFAVTPAGEQAG